MSDDFKPDVTGKWKSVKTSEFKKIVFLTMAEKTPNGVTKITGSAKMGSNKLKLNGVRKGKSVTLESRNPPGDERAHGVHRDPAAQGRGPGGRRLRL